MNLRAAEEAFFTAREMESRAIRLYERALMLFGQQQDMHNQISSILREEKEHLRRFTELSGEYFPSQEDPALLSAKAADALFTGGLVEAQRLGAFDSPRGLIAYAASQEQGAQTFYESMGKALKENGETDASEALLKIAREESMHLQSLNARLREMDA